MLSKFREVTKSGVFGVSGYSSGKWFRMLAGSFN